MPVFPLSSLTHCSSAQKICRGSGKVVIMERKQGFFSALKEEVVRGLSPARSRAKSPARSASPMSGLLRRRRKHHAPPPEIFVTRSGSLRPAEALSPLKEGPDGTDGQCSSRGEGRWGQWMKGPLARAPSVSSSSSSSSGSSSAAACKKSDLRLLLGVLGAPLAPVHVCTTDPFPHLSIKDIPIVSLCLCSVLLFCFWVGVKFW